MEIFSLNKQHQDYSYNKNMPSVSAVNMTPSDANIQLVLSGMHSEALQKINECNYLEAISDLLHCEEILEAVTSKGDLQDIDEVIILLNNIAMCYQRIGELDKALAYLDGSLYNFKIFASKPTVKNDIKMNSLIAKISLQSCALFSQKNEHKSALKFAKSSQTLMETSLNAVIKNFHKNSFKIKINPGKSGFMSLKTKNPISKNSSNLIKVLENYFSSKTVTNTKYKIKYPEWTRDLTISDIMLIEPISLMEFKEEFNINEELTIDAVIYKICLLASAHYCIATELNYIKNLNIFKDMDQGAVEKEYNQALNLLYMFLPANSKLFNHVYEGFIKNCGGEYLMLKESNSKVINNKITSRKQCLTPAILTEHPKRLQKTVKKNLSSSSSRPKRTKTLSVYSDTYK
jgi:tetratricopeptide (TPR) repeat protein